MDEPLHLYDERASHRLTYWEHITAPQPANAESSAELLPLSGKGTIYSFTTVTAPAADFAEYAPYPLALVQLDEGPLVTAQLTDLDAGQTPHIGQRVEMVIRKLRTDGARGIIIYGPKFRPVLGEGDTAE